jgi:type II secretory pathway component PulK
MRHGDGHHRAFVLLWTLALLALAAVVLAGLTRRSAARAVEAVDAQEQLQRKWALASCRKMMRENAEKLLVQAEKQQRAPVASMWLRGTLGEVQLQIRIADEQAKVNVNTIYDEMGKARTATLVHDVLRGSGSARILLRPDPRYARSKNAASPKGAANHASTLPTTAPAGWPAFGCWSQVFDSDDPAELVGRSLNSPTDQLTCWGNGELNLTRASPAAVRAMLGRFLSPGQIQTLLEDRSRKSGGTIDQWSAGMKLAADKGNALLEVVTDQSHCHSVMIHARSGARDWCELEVVESPKKSKAQQNSQAATSPSSPIASSDTHNDVGDRIYRLVW